MIGFVLFLTLWVYAVMAWPGRVLKFTGIFVGLFAFLIVAGSLIQNAQLGY
jgi:hypothetical protein